MLRVRSNAVHHNEPLSVSELRRILDDLQYSWHEFTIESFMAHAARKRGRRLVILPFVANPTLFGAWVGTPNAEYFCHAEDLQGHARTLVLAHEFSHWLLLHQTKRLTTNDLEYLLTGGDLDLSELQIVQQRSATPQQGHEDIEAERLAMLIMTRAAASQPPVIIDPSLRDYLDEWR